MTFLKLIIAKNNFLFNYWMQFKNKIKYFKFKVLINLKFTFC